MTTWCEKGTRKDFGSTSICQAFAKPWRLSHRGLAVSAGCAWRPSGVARHAGLRDHSRLCKIMPAGKKKLAGASAAGFGEDRHAEGGVVTRADTRSVFEPVELSDRRSFSSSVTSRMCRVLTMDTTSILSGHPCRMPFAALNPAE